MSSYQTPGVLAPFLSSSGKFGWSLQIQFLAFLRALLGESLQ